jgi:hypothetical protein
MLEFRTIRTAGSAAPPARMPRICCASCLCGRRASSRARWAPAHGSRRHGVTASGTCRGCGCGGRRASGLGAGGGAAPAGIGARMGGGRGGERGLHGGELLHWVASGSRGGGCCCWLALVCLDAALLVRAAPAVETVRTGLEAIGQRVSTPTQRQGWCVGQVRWCVGQGCYVA